jgi:hypothetical protein
MLNLRLKLKDMELQVTFEFWYKQEIKLMISYTSLAGKKALTAFTSLSNNMDMELPLIIKSHNI